MWYHSGPNLHLICTVWMLFLPRALHLITFIIISFYKLYYIWVHKHVTVGTPLEQRWAMWVEYDCSISFPGSIDNANFELLCHDMSNSGGCQLYWGKIQWEQIKIWNETQLTNVYSWPQYIFVSSGKELILLSEAYIWNTQKESYLMEKVKKQGN